MLVGFYQKVRVKQLGLFLVRFDIFLVTGLHLFFLEIFLGNFLVLFDQLNVFSAALEIF